MVYRLNLTLILLIISTLSFSQTGSYDSLKSAIINLETRVTQVELNLEQSRQKFKSGIFIATLGYTTTIVGGLMLGRSNDQLGQALLVVGGGTGVIGTYKMVDAFSYLTNRKKKRKRK